MTSSYYAAIDIGSNSFHMIIAEGREDKTFKIVDREREEIRLASSTDGSISKEEIESSVKILKGFKAICDFYSAKIKAVATSAVRDAKNSKDFIKQILTETGIEIETADGKKEAELIYTGVRNALKLKNKKVLCVDIGGGSTELVFDNHGCFEAVESFKLGAVRLSKMFFPWYKLTNEAIISCLEHIENTFLAYPGFRELSGFDIVVGSSGTIQAVASLINNIRNGYAIKQFNGYSFSYDELREVSDLILSCPNKEDRMRIRGMEEKRADILPAGVLILVKLFEMLNIENMTISSYALREGIIVEQLSHT